MVGPFARDMIQDLNMLVLSTFLENMILMKVWYASYLFIGQG